MERVLKKGELSMIRIQNKYLFIAVVGIALGLGILWPILVLAACSDFSFVEIGLFYVLIVLPAQIGLLILVSIWGQFEIKEAPKKH